MVIYHPREDSYLIQKHIKDYATSNVLDMGTGSGVLAKTAAECKKTKQVIAVDINPEVIEFVKKQKLDKVKVIQSDLFSNIKQCFDLVIFNPPYLPDDPRIKDVALDGGKHGYEVIERFLDDVNNHLNKEGKILLLFSSLSKKEKIHEFLQRNCFTYKQLDKEKHSFEELFVYLIEKSSLLKKLEAEKLKHITYFTKGHRGFLYKAKLGKKNVVVKAENPSSKAFGRIMIEGNWLKKLNKEKIGPKLLIAKNDYVIYEYVKGEFILDFIEKANKEQIIKVLRKSFEQCFALDKIKVNKEEMHHPVKHILVDDKLNVVMLDFERTHYTNKPKNVTQFCQFISSMQDVLIKKNIKIDKKEMIKLAKKYKQNNDLSEIRKFFGNL